MHAICERSGRVGRCCLAVTSLCCVGDLEVEERLQNLRTFRCGLLCVTRCSVEQQIAAVEMDTFCLLHFQRQGSSVRQLGQERVRTFLALLALHLHIFCSHLLHHCISYDLLSSRSLHVVLRPRQQLQRQPLLVRVRAHDHVVIVRCGHVEHVSPQRHPRGSRAPHEAFAVSQIDLATLVKRSV